MKSDPVSDAVAAVRSGELVVFPTDTVYGLAARPDSGEATEKLFTAKGRPEDLALPILGAVVQELREVAVFDARAEALASAFWPGPLTIVLPRSERIGEWRLGGEGQTVAVRVPRHQVAAAILTSAGPLAVTSANRSGEPPARSCDELHRVFGDLVGVYICQDAVIDGTVSTVIDLAHGPASILRAGAVEAAAVARVLPAGEALLDSRPSRAE